MAELAPAPNMATRPPLPLPPCASLQGIPAELKLEIVKHLDPLGKLALHALSKDYHTLITDLPANDDLVRNRRFQNIPVLHCAECRKYRKIKNFRMGRMSQNIERHSSYAAQPEHWYSGIESAVSRNVSFHFNQDLGKWRRHKHWRLETCIDCELSDVLKAEVYIWLVDFEGLLEEFRVRHVYVVPT
ncbi:hypothetical protein BT63DRAFT_424003 [Microthyrium microscopicum]|uniref:F-box domain-containing protein n=1 Tax=Microthyrium microscopicum TaxID=703497 RepID=A0A6A6UCP1_9PEZI|nr:hypothetical protein BT63DRAFT_424003 [Microthyrium microscopicum]